MNMPPPSPRNQNPVWESMRDLVSKPLVGTMWSRFNEITRLPRQSGKEDAVVEWLYKIAAEKGLEVRTDTGPDGRHNIVLVVPGRGKGIDAAPVVIQSHMDMVCIHADKPTFDGRVVPIREKREINGLSRDTLTSKVSTLGADNGIGMAAALALLDDNSITDCPPLELLFTYQEEKGLLGSKQLAPEILTGRRMINYDFEAEGSICIRCASSVTSEIEWSPMIEPLTSNMSFIDLSLRNFPGGHSGIEIHEQRGNPIVSLSEHAVHFMTRFPEARLVDIHGGEARNSIPSTCNIKIALPTPQLHDALTILNQEKFEGFFQAFVDPRLSLPIYAAVEGQSDTKTCYIATDSMTCLRAISYMPVGVCMWTGDGGDFRTPLLSNNPGVISTNHENGSIKLVSMTRGEYAEEIDNIIFEIQSISSFKETGILRECTAPQATDGWNASDNNPLIARAAAAIKSVFKRDAIVRGIHAGLENGPIDALYDGDMKSISIGPTMGDVHKIGEWIDIESAEKTFYVLRLLLQDLSNDPIAG